MMTPRDYTERMRLNSAAVRVEWAQLARCPLELTVANAEELAQTCLETLGAGSCLVLDLTFAQPVTFEGARMFLAALSAQAWMGEASLRIVAPRDHDSTRAVRRAVRGWRLYEFAEIADQRRRDTGGRKGIA